MKKAAVVMGAICCWALGFATDALAQKPPLLPEKDVAALANELSGETAKRNLEGMAQFHRQRGSKGFHEAAELVAERLRAYGLSDVVILRFPADGKIFYGTQRSRPAWVADFAELGEVSTHRVSGRKWFRPFPVGYYDGVTTEQKVLASYAAEPVVLAEDSESADVTAELVDVGEGTKESDYAGKVVKGKIVLVSAQPDAVQDLAVGKFGAAGIVSYAQNQKTAWSGENQDAIRWGHLETFSPNKTFAFMVSLKTAHGFQKRLADGAGITLHAVVKAGQHPGNYEVVTATIPGSDPKLKDEEIAFSCHLDHQRPGANDNASGCAAILEVARALQKLTGEHRSGGCAPVGKIPSGAMSDEARREFETLQQCVWLIGLGDLARPARTIRFIFPPEIEGTMASLNGMGWYATWNSKDTPNDKSINVSDHALVGAELVKRIKVVIHMDMVGGGPETKAVFHVTRGPMSLPSFVHDVAWSFAEWVNEESSKFAATGNADYPMVAPEGGKEPLRAEYSAYTMGSDHDVYQDSSFGIPAIYLNDWPDRFIHTNFDSAANIDPTKLKRAAFIGAASGYFLARLNGADYGPLLEAVKTNQFERTAQVKRRAAQLPQEESEKLLNEYIRGEKHLAMSIGSMIPVALTGAETLPPLLPTNGELKQILSGKKPDPYGKPLWKRKPEPKGPLAVFGYDYFAAEWARLAHVTQPGLLRYQGLWGGGEEYAYEVLNFANGQRNAQEIRDAVSAEYGPVPLEEVLEYLQALEEIGIVEEVKQR